MARHTITFLPLTVVLERNIRVGPWQWLLVKEVVPITSYTPEVTSLTLIATDVGVSQLVGPWLLLGVDW